MAGLRLHRYPAGSAATDRLLRTQARPASKITRLGVGVGTNVARKQPVVAVGTRTSGEFIRYAVGRPSSRKRMASSVSPAR
ncbi:MAG: hypothetical protein BUE48_003895 [Thermomonospora sp. CIF 1]|nr:MAG: hypothetical protein BUE48_003895 [Thermomonospora sp. CIF 1]